MEENRGKMVAWAYGMGEYMGSMDRSIWVCPAAQKPYSEGGRPPFASQNTDVTKDPVYYGSYTVNLWIATPEPEEEAPGKFWITPSMKGCAYAPMLMGGNWKDAEPAPEDWPAWMRQFKDY